MSRLPRILFLALIVVSLAASVAIARPPTFNQSSAGWISTDLLGTTPTVSTGTAAWGLSGDLEFRGFLDFDTSSMNSLRFPNITKVELYYSMGMTAVQEPHPDPFVANLYVGEFMADGLSYADWDAGAYAATKSFDPIVSTWIDLGQEGRNMFYVFGPDYIKYRAPEHYSVAIRNGGNGDFIAGLTRYCKLRVTYTPTRTILALDKAAAEEESSFGSVKALFR